MHISISFSAGGTKATVATQLQSQRDTAVATNPLAQQLADAALAQIAHELEPVDEAKSVTVSVSLYVGVGIAG